MSNTGWQPTATIKTLKQRAAILAKIRQFFAERQVLEVDTPLLCPHTVTDLYIDSFEVDGKFLQTSPEYAMKRLLAAGSGCIYQLCKSFRYEEAGRQHNPEFTMLEWYRVGFDHLQLMQEVDALLQTVLNTPAAEQITYQALFETHCGINPHHCSLDDLKQHIKKYPIDAPELDSKDDYLNLLLTHHIEPNIGKEKPTFIYDYPSSQAALAKIRLGTPTVAERFELYYKGTELANGFHELTDANEQLQRFEHDQHLRKQHHKYIPNIDTKFIEALTHGLPNCAGVALGIDRLIMLACDAKSIADVVTFT